MTTFLNNIVINELRIDNNPAKGKEERENKKIRVDKMSNNGVRIPNSSPQVSCFENYFAKSPQKTVGLWEWLKSDQFESKVKEYRQTRREKRRLEIKSQLPCITPSGVFSTRNKNGLIQHSRYICIDIDYDQNKTFGRDWFEAKTKLSKVFPSLCYAGMSVSGNGIYLIFHIAHPERHKEHFNALVWEIREKTGLIADESCCDITRLRGASYDQYPILRTNAPPYTQIRRDVRRKSVCRTAKAQDATDAKVHALIDKIYRDKIDITVDYKDWYAIGCALAAEYGKIEGLSLFHIISAKSPKYYETECDEQFWKCHKYGTRTKIATFFYICQKYGVTFK